MLCSRVYRFILLIFRRAVQKQPTHQLVFDSTLVNDEIIQNLIFVILNIIKDYIFKFLRYFVQFKKIQNYIF